MAKHTNCVITGKFMFYRVPILYSPIDEKKEKIIFCYVYQFIGE